MSEKVVSSLTEEAIHLMGHSFGGVIALALALKGHFNISKMSLCEAVAVSVLEKNNEVQEFLVKYRRKVSKKPLTSGEVIDFWGGKGVFQSLADFIQEGS
ncbi:hypothetical protein [uncultured Shewanella sp.]|uniref:alpha/beta fold hydrolase n=1 Tax=uncultured Shewanella sp. TaxID=173975 RepID=UPI0026237443|nr:hypothetical protein [uncultured Shewanella sp.]